MIKSGWARITKTWHGTQCETKTVTTALYLDFNGVETPMALTDPMHFVGRAGLFCPIQEGKGGGLLMREKDGKFYAAVGTKGYRWLESEMVEVFNKKEDINMQYFDSLVNDAIENISKYGDFEWFTD